MCAPDRHAGFKTPQRENFWSAFRFVSSREGKRMVGGRNHELYGSSFESYTSWNKENTQPWQELKDRESKLCSSQEYSFLPKTEHLEF
ncbi:hypothetical protein MTO96_005574 [Rhipicephalus appendiculatus]